MDLDLQITTSGQPYVIYSKFGQIIPNDEQCDCCTDAVFIYAFVVRRGSHYWDIKPLPGPLLLTYTANRASFISWQGNQSPEVFNTLSNVLHATSPPVASLLDDNWISRSITDLPVMAGGQIESCLEGGKVDEDSVWLFPERYVEHARKIITKFSPTPGSSTCNDDVAWRIGWTTSG